MDDSQIATADSGPQIQEDEDEFAGTEEVRESLVAKIARFLWTCWERRRMVLGFLVIGSLISVFYALSLRPFYTSTTTLMPPGGSSTYASIMSVLSPESAADELGSEAFGLESRGDLFIAVMKSRNVEDALINRLDLARYYGASTIADARLALEGSTKIEVDRKSGIITVSATASNPVLASNIAQGYVEELNRVMTDDSTSAARRERIFLEGRVKDVKEKLDESAKELSQFSTKSGAIDVPSQTKSIVDQGLRLQAQLSDGRSELAALRQTLSESNVKVRSLEAHNAELQQELDKMGGMPQGSGSGANEDTSKSPYPTADELPTLGLTYYNLEREMRVEETLWEALTKQYEVAKVEEAEELPTVRVLDTAEIPARKTGPVRRLIVELGALFSLVVALIAVFAGMIWEAMDPQNEPKRTLTKVIDGAMDSQRWYWKLPGMGWIHRRSRGSEHPR
jgi:uncharacterized protein involved in exopolysaccharide biosynthesis